MKKLTVFAGLVLTAGAVVAGEGTTEETPGGWSGYISYTLQGTAYGLGTGNFKPGRFWRDGDGANFKTVDHNAANAISTPGGS